MKTFTRLALVLTLLCVQASAFAATWTVTVRDNDYSPQFLNIQPGDVVRWQWASGVHPTMSDSSPAAWSTFTPSASTTRSITFNTLGSFPYHCTAHGAPGAGMYGEITVSPVPTPTLNLRNATASLDVYPSPARGGQVTVAMGDAKANGIYQLRVSNIIGSEVRSISLRPELVAKGQPVDLSGLPAGIYFCNLLVNDKAIATKRITIQD
ncbi:T9SS type A sorting domain-containing protein [Hymenobacter busanensis]|uniref:T9SS type A sorting domain-containing protein n=1 Tax=Hymenobacter busanensis TaxID=2607656 RepID=A0A7L5A0L9_9BACT|nr:T9SS type A sorting domain-containing protein [Hymenobacter busanensis]KAA9338491.1 T9SS type A sorting domain-containing protein [Hymenobacter busanensis]QHJ09081.1 T9SS type A sorting domain-containing protein [Hymenobacter busanensis]